MHSGFVYYDKPVRSPCLPVAQCLNEKDPGVGYRFLAGDEIIDAKDEVKPCNGDLGWVPTNSGGKFAGSQQGCVYRRKIEYVPVHEQHVEMLRQQLADAAAQLKARNLKVASQRRELIMKTTMLEDYESIVTKLKAKVCERAWTIEDLKAAVGERDRVIAELKAKVRDLEELRRQLLEQGKQKPLTYINIARDEDLKLGDEFLDDQGWTPVWVDQAHYNITGSHKPIPSYKYRRLVKT